MQAAVRGHLVRKQAIGTLRCVQAIAKIQVLVRARRAHHCQLLDKDIGQEKSNDDLQIDLVTQFYLYVTILNRLFPYISCTMLAHLGSTH